MGLGEGVLSLLEGGGVRRYAADGTLELCASFGWVNPEGIARGAQGEGALARFHLDSARLDCIHFRQVQGEHAVSELR